MNLFGNNNDGKAIDYEIKHFHLFCGLGGGARGFNRGQARVGTMQAKFRCIGGIDNDRAAIRDFGRLAGVPGTVLDLFSREQYEAFHGEAPPVGWREANAADIHAAAGNETPNIIFLSAPCKGFSGLLSETRSRTDKYQALNSLTLRGVWLALEAWKNDPPELWVFENVPRIANRGRSLLDRIVALLRSYGYAVAETTHDCGELGGLAQSRKRFLLVARHMRKVPPFLYEPEKHSLRAVGDVLGKLPVPGLGIGGPMHRVPALQWKTWVRLAFVEAGKDWRSLNRLNVVDGNLADYLIMPESSFEGSGQLGVNKWEEPAGTVAGCSRPGNGNFSVADPRYDGQQYKQYGVVDWKEPMGTVTSQRAPGQGSFSVSDPRMNDEAAATRHKNVFRVVQWDQAAGTISGGHGPSSGGQCVADPRHHGPAKHNNEMRISKWDGHSAAVTGAHGTGQCIADPRYADGQMGSHTNKMRVVGWQGASPTVTGSDRVGSGAMSIADPRINGDRHGPLGVHAWKDTARTIAGESFPTNGAFSVADPRVLHREKGDNYLTGGHYGVVSWAGQTGAVSGSACHDNGGWSVADPRMPEATDNLVAVIRAIDGTWHRPFTTLELASLQSLVDPEDFLELDGLSDSAWRERIGNAVPSDAAAAIASVMGHTLLLAATGRTFMLSSAPIWVRPIAVALSVAQP